jgi:hypothetical protein
MVSITREQIVFSLFPGSGRKRLDASRRSYIVKVMKLMECAESKEEPLIQMVRMYLHVHNTNSTFFHMVNNFKKS